MTTLPPSARTIYLNPDKWTYIARKAPDEISDWMIVWGKYELGDDVIISSVWEAEPPGLETNANAPSFTPATTTVWLSEGVSGVGYTVTNTVITAGGRTLQGQFKCLLQS
jgi:hypothetical protein